jgi:acyl-CoA thioesterase
MTDFSTAVELTPAGERRWTANLTDDWAQGRTSFGGLLAALAARAAVEVAGADRPLRTLDVAFVAPLPSGPVELDVEVLGAGKAVTQLAVSIRSGGVLGCRVHVVAGAARVSALRVDAAPTELSAELAEVDPAEQGIQFPYLPGLTPAFTQHIEYRWCSDAFPFTGGGPETARISGWARHRTAAEGLEAAIALLDAWPPVVLPMASGPTPGSTVRWAIHLAGPSQLSEPGEPAFANVGKQWFWYEARAVSCADGYATGYASMFTEDGRLVAWSEQLMAVYDRPGQPPVTVAPPE